MSRKNLKEKMIADMGFDEYSAYYDSIPAWLDDLIERLLNLGWCKK